MKSNNESENPKSAANLTPEETEALIEQIIAEGFGLPKVIPLTHKKIPWNQLSQEQIVAEIERMLAEDFDVPRGPPLTFLQEIKWKDLSPEQIEAEIKRILFEEIDSPDDEVGIHDFSEKFNPEGNLTGSSLFEGQRIKVRSEHGTCYGKVSYLFSEGDAFTIDSVWEKMGCFLDLGRHLDFC
jgi:hypothetical protein